MMEPGETYYESLGKAAAWLWGVDLIIGRPSWQLLTEDGKRKMAEQELLLLSIIQVKRGNQ